MVDGAEVELMLAEWGSCRNCAADLGLLLSSWGGC
jgi:hypothetical protein